MTMTRAFKRLVSAGLVGLILFAQLAIAAYACPALQSAGAGMQAVAAAAGGDQVVRDNGMAATGADAGLAPMPGCDQMGGAPDEAAPNLCAEHCHFGQQGNQSQVPSLPMMTLVSLYTVAATVPDEASLPVTVRTASLAMPAAVPIPHAILHCCIRD